MRGRPGWKSSAAKCGRPRSRTASSSSRRARRRRRPRARRRGSSGSASLRRRCARRRTRRSAARTSSARRTGSTRSRRTTSGRRSSRASRGAPTSSSTTMRTRRASGIRRTWTISSLTLRRITDRRRLLWVLRPEHLRKLAAAVEALRVLSQPLIPRLHLQVYSNDWRRRAYTVMRIPCYTRITNLVKTPSTGSLERSTQTWTRRSDSQESETTKRKATLRTSTNATESSTRRSLATTTSIPQRYGQASSAALLYDRFASLFYSAFPCTIIYTCTLLYGLDVGEHGVATLKPADLQCCEETMGGMTE